MKKYVALIGIIMGMFLMLSGCAEKDEMVLTRGIWNGNQFTNEDAGITLNLPEEWTVASDEEMIAMLGAGVELMDSSNSEASKEEIEKAMDLMMVHDVLVSDPVNFSNIVIQYTNLKKVSGGTRISEEKYMEDLISELEEMELDYIIEETSELEIGDRRYITLIAKLEVGNIEMEQMHLLRRQGNYIVNISITRLPGIDFETILGYFE
jgi:hypothetical protein